MGGTLYLVIIAAGLFAEMFVRDQLVVRGNAAATATNITSYPLMFRLGIVADLSTYVCAVAVSIILFRLLAPVSRGAALLMLSFNLVQDSVGGLNALNAYRPLQLLGGAPYLQTFSREQLEALALLSINAHSVGFAGALMFFGGSCIALGYLMFRSGLFPGVLGLLMAMAGVCYLLNSTAVFLSPRLASMLFPAILVPALIGELSCAVADCERHQRGQMA
jgi:hypothetical protein